MASVRIRNWTRTGKKGKGTGAWYGLITASKQGYMSKAKRQAESKARQILGDKLASKIAAQIQKDLQ